MRLFSYSYVRKWRAFRRKHINRYWMVVITTRIQNDRKRRKLNKMINIVIICMYGHVLFALPTPQRVTVFVLLSKSVMVLFAFTPPVCANHIVVMQQKPNNTTNIEYRTETGAGVQCTCATGQRYLNLNFHINI